jgi:ribonuclease HI
VLGIGIIARDDAGKFLNACSMKKQMSVRPVVAEAIAACYAMLFAKEKGYRHVCFKGDALSIVKEVNNTYPCESSHGHFVEDVKIGLLSFESSRFSHVKREANMAAHVLAKQVCNHATDVFRWHSIPHCIRGIIGKEALSPSL